MIHPINYRSTYAEQHHHSVCILRLATAIFSSRFPGLFYISVFISCIVIVTQWNWKRHRNTIRVNNINVTSCVICFNVWKMGKTYLKLHKKNFLVLRCVSCNIKWLDRFANSSSSTFFSVQHFMIFTR